jgi:translocation and assembly module TamB
LLDSAGNVARLDGNINAKDFANMELDLRVNARNWQALNSTKKDNDLFYGKLFLNTNMRMRGTTAKPDIEGSLNILPGTDFTVVSPENNPQIVSSEGIVKFIDKDMPGEILPVMPPKDTVRLGFAPGSNINVNLTIDPEAKFSFVIDKATGDFVNVKGDAALNANIGNDGAMTLTGMYKLNDGAYELNYNLIKRRFRIKEGSTITFAGDPLAAELNVTAIYTANIPSYDLVERQVPDPAQLNYYRQRLPFEVQLILKGEMMQPTITFNIELPEDKVYRMTPDQLELVRSKLNQVKMDTSELTKQVFAVLLLNRFISDDPFSNGTGTNLAFTAKQSASRFIGEQLNKFANDLVKGIELNVDLAQSEDYTTGARRERTDLSLSASKSLLNDRLKITIGNDFELQGPQTTNNRNTSGIPGNLAADYNLTTDGRYVVRAYRRSYDEGVLQGFVTETGLNFIVSMDYNRFAQLFRRTRTREDRRQNREDRRKMKEANAATLVKKEDEK